LNHKEAQGARMKPLNREDAKGTKETKINILIFVSFVIFVPSWFNVFSLRP